MQTAAVSAALGDLLGSRVRSISRLSGGDINEAYCADLATGTRVFAKCNPRAPLGFFAQEARGLEWLAEPGVIRLPQVLAISQGPVPLLVLEHYAPEPPQPEFWETLGRQLAALHSNTARVFGALPDNFIGTLPQDNRPQETWARFFWQRRLEPQLQRASDAQRLPVGWLGRFAKLRDRLDTLLPEPAFPERVHGDLWSGNFLCSAQTPVLIDPAAYAGHGEVDLAMMRLFGGFDERTFDAYQETRPSEPALASRLPVYQLYPLLVHLNLFGSSYLDALDRVLARYA